MNLTNDDYEKIVKHYGYDVPKTKKNRRHNNKTRKLARNILVSKLCKCIKKIQKTNKAMEQSAIPICKKSIFSNRNIKYFGFRCKKPRLLTKKGRNYYLQKTRKQIGFLKDKSLKSFNKDM